MQSNLIKGSLLNLETQRKFAKIGLGVSLTVATLSAFNMRSRGIKAVHVIAGAVLVGFSIYHYGLYNNGFAQRFINNARKKQNLKASRLNPTEIQAKTHKKRI